MSIYLDELFICLITLKIHNLLGFETPLLVQLSMVHAPITNSYILLIITFAFLITPIVTMATFKRPRDSLAEVDTKGRFVRTESGFREKISSEHPIFKPEANRYHLYVS